MHVTPRRQRSAFQAICAIVLGLMLASQVFPASASSGASRSSNDFRFQDTVSVTVFTNVQSPEVGPPEGEWFWQQAVLDELNIDVNVQFQTQTSEYQSTLLTKGGANDLPDLFQMDLNSATNLAGQGLLGDWNPYLEFMPTYVEQNGVNELVDVGTRDGKMIALATQNSNPFKTIIAIRQDWLDKLGLEYPKTTDEFLAVMTAFTEQDPDGNGQADTYGWSGSVNSQGQITAFEPIFGAFGALGDWAVADNQLLPVATTDGRKQALEFIAQMNAAGVIDPDWTSQTAEDFRAKWKAGRLGMFTEDWCATLCVQGYGEFVAANPTGMLTIIDPPVGPGGLSSMNVYTDLGDIYGMSQRAADDGKGEAIARLLEWINGPGYERTAFGVEGENFTRNADGSLLQINEPTAIQNVQIRGWGYRGDEAEWLARYGAVQDYDNGQTIDVYNDVLLRAAELPKTDTTPFASLPPVPAEISADYRRTLFEGEFAFASGQRAPEEWDAHIEALNAVGLQTWVDAATERATEIGLIT